MRILVSPPLGPCYETSLTQFVIEQELDAADIGVAVDDLYSCGMHIMAADSALPFTTLEKVA